MEKIGSINRIWKMSLVWTFIGCLILLLILNYQTCQNSSFSAPLCQLSHLPTTSTSMTTSNLQQTPEVAASSNITISDHTTTPTTTTNNFQQTPKMKPQTAASSNITISDHTISPTTTTNNFQQTPNVKPQTAASSNITISNHTTTPTNTTNNFQQTPEVKPQIAASDNITISGQIYTTTNTTTTSTSRSEANDQVTSDLIEKVLQREVTTKKKKKKKKKKKCNIFEGRWVYDPKQVPSYDAERCPMIANSLRCQENGRPDSEYLKWRWEATDCDIPL